MYDCEQLFQSIFPFWGVISPDDRDNLCRHTTLTHYRKSENIHGGDGKCTGAIIVKTGCVRAYMLSEEGKEITLYRLFPGDICMLSASCVLNSITFDVMVDAETDCECYILNGKVLSDVSEKDIHVKAFALEVATERFSDVMWVMQQILFMSMDRRLAIFLYDESAKTGKDILALSNEQIAKYIGSAREVVSRMLKYFKSEGIAERTRDGVVILDKRRLKELAL